MKFFGLIAGAVMLLGAQSAYAVSITNGSFEDPIASGAYEKFGNGSTGITGWTVGGDSVELIGSYWQPSQGNQSLDLSGDAAGSISQTLNGLTIGQKYILKFDMAGNPDSADLKSLTVSVGGPAQQYDFDNTTFSKTNMGWAAQTFIFYATAISQTLTFTSLNLDGHGPALDNVSIAATPIPGAILLFGSALGGMGFLGFRRKKLQAAA